MTAKHNSQTQQDLSCDIPIENNLEDLTGLVLPPIAGKSSPQQHPSIPTESSIEDLTGLVLPFTPMSPEQVRCFILFRKLTSNLTYLKPHNTQSLFPIVEAMRQQIADLASVNSRPSPQVPQPTWPAVQETPDPAGQPCKAPYKNWFLSLMKIPSALPSDGDSLETTYNRIYAMIEEVEADLRLLDTLLPPPRQPKHRRRAR